MLLLQSFKCFEIDGVNFDQIQQGLEFVDIGELRKMMKFIGPWLHKQVVDTGL
jgi:hypothetical protein